MRHLIHRVARWVLPLIVIAVAVTAVDSADSQKKGRYKKQGEACVWDANDSGPDQCTPPAGKGRFKKEGDKCLWVATDSGADQCRPATGRFKKEGNKCVWNASDSGSDQCDPRTGK